MSNDYFRSHSGKSGFRFVVRVRNGVKLSPSEVYFFSTREELENFRVEYKKKIKGV